MGVIIYRAGTCKLLECKSVSIREMRATYICVCEYMWNKVRIIYLHVRSIRIYEKWGTNV